MCDQFKYSSVFRGHHVYKDVFMHAIGRCSSAEYNVAIHMIVPVDRHAVITIENDAVLYMLYHGILLCCIIFYYSCGLLLVAHVPSSLASITR